MKLQVCSLNSHKNLSLTSQLKRIKRIKRARMTARQMMLTKKTTNYTMRHVGGPVGFVTSVSADIPVLVSVDFQKFKLIPVSVRVLMAGYTSSAGQVPAGIFLNYT